MKNRKFFNIVVSLMVLTTLLFGGNSSATALQARDTNASAASLSAQNAPAASTNALPISPTDETKVPHYFGPWPNWANSPLTLADATVQITGDGQGATAVASVGANGVVDGITLTNPGSGYTTASVNITGSGTGATANAVVLASGAITAVAVNTSGSGYTSPVVTFTGGGGVGTLTQVGNQLIGRTYATDYATAPGTLGPVFVVLQTTMPAAGQVTGIQYFNQATLGGSPTPSAGNLFHAYVLHPTANANEYSVLWDSGELTVPATADLVGVIETIAVPNIAVTTGDTIAFYGEGIPVDDLGTGTDTLSYPAPVAPGNLLTLGGVDFPVYGQTRTYSIAANVIDMSAVAPLTNATATAYGGVDAVTLQNAGFGYTMPTVDFDLPDAPDGVQAKAHATIDASGAITAVIVDAPGSGYSAAPNVVIRDGTLFDPINNGGSGAVATATISISTVAIDTFGAGYTSAPSVTFADAIGTGAGASASAQVNAGTVSAINLTSSGSGYITAGGIKKFTDPLPGLCLPPACPATGKYIPLAVSETKSYNGVNADEYVIGLVQYRSNFSSSLPDSFVRGYVQIETAANAGVSQHFPLVNEMLDGTTQAVLINGAQAYAVTPPQYLGPTIAATKDRPVRIVFYNLLPTGSGGDLFLPTDSTLMGSGMGPMGMPATMDQGSVTDEVRNPLCSEYPKSDMCFKDSRATLHLHGGTSPWISDGTPHQWITPAGENTQYPQGVSVQNVPDMNVCGSATDGCQTFYYTNQQSARLMFYHDHAWGLTRLNVYAGEAAGYLISDNTEKALINSGTIPGAADTIPLIIQDKTFVPDAAQLALQDPTWDTARWGTKGSFWYHHVYMPAQNPGDPSGMSAYGRWMYGPWFWPPAANTLYGPIANPYYNPNCNLDVPSTWQYQTDPFCEPAEIPGTPNISVGMEQFNDTPIVNGVAYPTLTLQPKAYRLRMLSAANDRFFNFQWYVADSTTASTSVNTLGQIIGGTEVALDPTLLAAAQTDPNVFPTPVQGAATTGPDWIQIGTEGGFLPAPAVIDGQQPTTWIIDPTRFDVGNVDKHSLLLAPAERADVIVDFSKFAGKTLILYNDAPAAFPARVASYDYYTGAPDLSPVGAPTILPGYGPNTRTIMQIKIAGTAAPAFNLTKLQTAFKHNASGTGVFESGQHPIIVGQAAYNSAYGTSFAASSNCNVAGSTLTRCDGLVRINDTSVLGFNTLKGPAAKMTLPLQPKAIHDEMNSTTFDEFGRMQATLGVEAQPPVPGAQNVVLYPYVNPSTELIDGTNLPKAAAVYDANGNPVGDVKVTPISSATDGTQIWRITHNGVDTHPIHFHLFDVQLLNRVTWDNIIITPDANELGWKDTVRISPLEDTVVALRPIIPNVPFEVPNAVRLLNPMMPLGSTAMFNNVDPQGNPTNPITNQLVNFGWEYVYHCHILSHEEMDMMRPVSLVLPPNKADGLAFSFTGNGNSRRIVVTWNDNSITETSFQVQRTTDGTTWTTVGTILSPLDQSNTHGIRSFTDTTSNANTAYLYRVVALNAVGYGSGFPTMTAQSVSASVGVNAPAAPTTLTATLQSGPQVGLTWRDNATSETGFIIERATNGGAFTQIATAPARNNTGNVTFVDTTVQQGLATNTYVYRVAATNIAGLSAYTNTAQVVIAAATPPAAPNNAVATLQAGPQIRVTFNDNANNEAGFVLERSDNGGAFAVLANLGVRAGTGSVAYTDTAIQTGHTYQYRVKATNAAGSSAYATTAVVTVPAMPAAPSNFTAANGANSNNNRSVVLTWRDNSTNETGFTIERATNSTFTNGYTATNFAGSATTGTRSLTVTGLNRGTNYYFRIRANNGTILFSGWVNATPLPIRTNP
ncbi:MAG: multicopper oxidase domain-containing protein [Chloroflexota bacterium]